MKLSLLCGLAALLIVPNSALAPALAQDEHAEQDASAPAPKDDNEARANSPFVGRYDGNSFETAMRMAVRADGTWGWELSVGALDMRAIGTWEERDGFLHLTSTPKPVAPKFSWSGLESTGAAPDKTPFITVVWAESGEPFRYASVTVRCENGEVFSGQVRSDGYPSESEKEWANPLPPGGDPRQSCDTPRQVVLTQTTHDIRSQPFDLKQLGWEPGTTVRFAFHRNDLGVADFTGMTGYLEGGMLKLTGGKWPLELRKMPAKPSAHKPMDREQSGATPETQPDPQ